MFEIGMPYLDSLIAYGRASEDSHTKETYLFIAYGVATRHQCYKPIFDSEYSIDENFDFLESGDYSKVGIHQL
jgi:hypothetical protein